MREINILVFILNSSLMSLSPQGRQNQRRGVDLYLPGG